MKLNSKTRATMVGMLIGGVFSVFSYRLIQLQVIQHDESGEPEEQSHVVKQMIPAQRGAIRDVHGEVLAADFPMRQVVVDASHVEAAKQTQTVTALLSHALDMPAAEVSEKLATGRRYLVVKHQVPEDTVTQIQQQIDKQHLHGITFEPDSVRLYPNGSVLCHLLGYTGFANKEQQEQHGIQGVEMSMDKYLQGEAGYRYIERDRSGVELVQHRGIEQAPRNGYNVQLTVDMALQSIVEEELDAAVAKYTPESAIAIMMRPKTGEILALANRPNFDLNKRSTAQADHVRNRAITDMVEPGSTFKIVTVSAALNEKVVTPDTEVYCENGRWEYCKNLLRDAHPYGNLSVHDILVHSSNIGAAKLGVQLGENRLYRQIRTYGFGDRTGIDLPGEIGGMVNPINRWSKISITHIPMGHEVCVTPLQLVMAMGAIANGGKLMMPHIIHSITDEADQPIADFPPVAVRQTVGPEAVREVVSALEDVVSPRGTAKGAAVPGFRVAGKTGTAQKVNPNGGYYSGKYVVSFVGFMPADDPEFVCLVMLDNAHTQPGGNYGGLVAAPIFANIAAKAARHLNLEPSEATTLVQQNNPTPSDRD